jgi:hypothetical protein
MPIRPLGATSPGELSASASRSARTVRVLGILAGLSGLFVPLPYILGFSTLALARRAKAAASESAEPSGDLGAIKVGVIGAWIGILVVPALIVGYGAFILIYWFGYALFHGGNLPGQGPPY